MSESGADKILSVIPRDAVANEFKELHWTGSFRDYLDKVLEEPRIARNAYQRVYDMVLSHGTEEYVERKERVTRYRFFSDPFTGGKILDVQFTIGKIGDARRQTLRTRAQSGKVARPSRGEGVCARG